MVEIYVPVPASVVFIVSPEMIYGSPWQSSSVRKTTGLAAAVHAVVLRVGELERVASDWKQEGGTGPRNFARLGDEVGIVEEEVELVVVGFRGYLIEEGDAVGHGEGDGDADFCRLAVGEAGGGAQAERAGIGTCVGDCPGIGALCPVGGMIDTTFEGF